MYVFYQSSLYWRQCDFDALNSLWDFTEWDSGYHGLWILRDSHSEITLSSAFTTLHYIKSTQRNATALYYIHSAPSPRTARSLRWVEEGERELVIAVFRTDSDHRLQHTRSLTRLIDQPRHCFGKIRPASSFPHRHVLCRRFTLQAQRQAHSAPSNLQTSQC